MLRARSQIGLLTSCSAGGKVFVGEELHDWVLWILHLDLLHGHAATWSLCGPTASNLRNSTSPPCAIALQSGE